MAFEIGSVKSVGDPESFGHTPDDRIQEVPCIVGAYVEDMGYHGDGPANCTIYISESDYNVLKGYRQSKAAVNITDHRGNFMGTKKFKITKVEYEAGTEYRKVSLEIYTGG